MVGYDDTNDALTLGDDDDLVIGDYRVGYNSTSGDWEAVYEPTGDVASVPTNQGGSLFPTDFADALAGKALADDGNLYSTVQGAENAATDWVFVGPGTFAEAVTVDTSGLKLWGCGYETLIDGGTTTAITVSGTGVSDVTIKNLSVQTTAAGGNVAMGIDTARPNTTVENVTVRDSDHQGINLDAADCAAYNCTVESGDASGIHINTGGLRCIAIGNRITGTGTNGVKIKNDDSIVADNVILNVGGHGIVIPSANDCLVGGNRIHNSGNDGIAISNTQNSIFNNRVSGSTNLDIDDNGTSTMLDGNSTGAAN